MEEHKGHVDDAVEHMRSFEQRLLGDEEEPPDEAELEAPKPGPERA